MSEGAEPKADGVEPMAEEAERMAEARVLREVARAFPDLQPQRVAFLGSGVDSDAYLLDDTWVFRFPKRPDVSTALAREIALLPRLAERLPVAVPRFEYIGRQTERGLLFVGYRAIPGEPLTRDVFDALTPAAQGDILQTLAQFLEVVHRFPLSEARAAGVEDLSVRDLVAESWSAARTRTLAALSLADGAALTALIERFLADAASADTPATLLYADFAPEHLLFDRSSNRLAGIIDWGDLAIGDPDFDLTYLYQDYGQEFVERLLAYLPHPEPARLLTKLRAFCAWDYLHDIANADADADADAVDGLRALVQQA